MLLSVGRPSATRQRRVLVLRSVLTGQNASQRWWQPDHLKTHHMLTSIIACYVALMNWRTTVWNCQNVDDMLIILQV